MLKRHPNATTLMAEVTDVDVERRQVVLERGERLDYDSLIVACGGETSYFGHDEWQEVTCGLKKAFRKGHVFPGSLLEEAITVSVTEEFANVRVAELPTSFRFWTFCRTEGISSISPRTMSLRLKSGSSVIFASTRFRRGGNATQLESILALERKIFGLKPNCSEKHRHKWA